MVMVSKKADAGGVLKAVVRYLRDSANLCTDADDVTIRAALSYVADQLERESVVVLDDYILNGNGEGIDQDAKE